MNKTGVSKSQSQSNYKKEKHEQRQRKTDRNCHKTTNLRTMHNDPCRPKIHAWHGLIEWPKCHQTNLNVTTISFYLANELHIASQGMTECLTSELYQSIDTFKPNSFCHLAWRHLPPFPSRGDWRWLRQETKGARINRVQEINRHIHRTVQLPTWHHCTILEFFSKNGKAVQ